MEEQKPKRVRKPITEKQRAARLANLASGRKKRMEAAKAKKQSNQHEEATDYDTDDTDESSSEGFVISKKKQTRVRPRTDVEPNDLRSLRGDFDELKDIVKQMAILQKKSRKRSKSVPVPLPQREATNVIVVGGSATKPEVTQSRAQDDYMAKLRKTIFD